jgi:hypothetical protein
MVENRLYSDPKRGVKVSVEAKARALAGTRLGIDESSAGAIAKGSVSAIRL